jgi:hypothetical protein
MDEGEHSSVPGHDQAAVDAFFACVKAVADPESLQTMIPALQRRLKQPPTALLSAILEQELTDGQVGHKCFEEAELHLLVLCAPCWSLYVLVASDMCFPAASG